VEGGMMQASGTVHALQSAAEEWADQGCIATADLMREAVSLIQDQERAIEMLREINADLEKRVEEDDARWSSLTIKAVAS
jgi:hypothetical protein